MPQDDSPPPEMPRKKRGRTPQTIDLAAEPAAGSATPAEHLLNPPTDRPADWAKSDPEPVLTAAASVAASADVPANQENMAAEPHDEPVPPPRATIPPEPERSAPASRPSILPGAIAGLLAGAAAALAVTLLWPRPVQTASPQIAELQRAVGDLQAAQAGREKRLAELEKRPAVDTAASERKVAELDERIAPLLALPARVDTLEQMPKAAGEQVIAGLTQRIDGLAKDLADLRAHPGAAAQAQAAGRLALIARIDSALQRGQPFQDELAALSTLGAPPDKIDMLRHAATGVPRLQDLAANLPALPQSAAATRTEAGETDAGFLDRLKASAADLVRVRRADEEPADPRTGQRAAIEANLKAGDTAKALAAIDALAPDSRASFASLADQLKARRSAEAALSALAAEAAGTFRSPVN